MSRSENSVLGNNSLVKNALHFVELGFEVFPLSRMSKLPLPGISWLNLMTRDPAKVQKWLASGDLNFALHPGEDKVIVDVDTKGESKGAESYLWLDIQHGWPATLEQKTPTGGRHLVYTVPHPVSNATGIFPGIDIRGWHGYVVGAGSTVPAGEYTISRDEKIAPAPAWLLEVLKEQRAEKNAKKSPEVEATPGAEDRCRKYLDSLPPTTETRNATAYQVACSCRDRGADPALTKELMVSVWKCEPSLDNDELEGVILNAFIYAKSEPGVLDPTKLFRVSPVVPNASPVQTAQTPSSSVATPAPSPCATVLSPLDRYNQSCCVCGGEVWVHQTDENDTLVWRPMNRAAFTLHFNNDLAVFDGNGKKDPIWKHWLGWENRRTVDQVVFAPGRELDNRSLNLWQGWTADPDGPVDDEGRWATQAWFDHVQETLCHNNLALAHKVIGWCAQAVQDPSERPLWCLVITGAKGSGKNAFIDRFGELFLNNYVICNHERYLKSNFNAHMERALVFALNEARCSGDEQADATLKALVTDRYITIERKGIDSYQRRIYARIVIQGNEDWQVKATSDERRYCVLKTSSAALDRMGRLEYNRFFQRMRIGFQTEHGGRNLLLKRLLEYDISDIDFSYAPDTPYLSEQKELSLTHTFSWWLESLKAGRVLGGTFPVGWPEVNIAKTALLKARNDYAASMGYRLGVTMSKLTKDLKRCCPLLDPNQKTTGGGEREAAFKLPVLKSAREAWVRTMGVDVNWAD